MVFIINKKGIHRTERCKFVRCKIRDIIASNVINDVLRIGCFIGNVIDITFIYSTLLYSTLLYLTLHLLFSVYFP